MPAPAMAMERPAMAGSTSGGFVLIERARRHSFLHLQRRIIDIERRAVGADALIGIAHIDEDVGMVERRLGAHAHEFLNADLNGTMRSEEHTSELQSREN